MLVIHYILFFLIFQMNLEYFAIDSQVTIFLQKDNWSLMLFFILLYILEKMYFCDVGSSCISLPLNQ